MFQIVLIVSIIDNTLKVTFVIANLHFQFIDILGQRLGEWTRNYGSAATERKIYVGKGIKYFSNIGVPIPHPFPYHEPCKNGDIPAYKHRDWQNDSSHAKRDSIYPILRNFCGDCG